MNKIYENYIKDSAYWNKKALDIFNLSHSSKRRNAFKNNNRTQRTLYIEDATWDNLKRIAIDKNERHGNLAAQAIKEYVERESKIVKQTS